MAECIFVFILVCTFHLNHRECMDQLEGREAKKLSELVLERYVCFAVSPCTMIILPTVLLSRVQLYVYTIITNETMYITQSLCLCGCFSFSFIAKCTQCQIEELQVRKAANEVV